MERGGAVDRSGDRTHDRAKTRDIRSRANDGGGEEIEHLRVCDGHYREYAGAGGGEVRAFYEFTSRSCFVLRPKIFQHRGHRVHRELGREIPTGSALLGLTGRRTFSTRHPSNLRGIGERTDAEEGDGRRRWVCGFDNGAAAGKGLDMLESTPITGSDARITGISTASGDYKETANSDVVVITAGFPRKPGMSRDDLLKANYEVIKAVVQQVAKYSPNAILIMVTNPLDAMVQVAYKVSGFSKNRVMGMAGVLDSARMSTFVATELGVSVENVHSFVLGGHGDDMVPLPRYSTVVGIPLPDLLPAERIAAIVDRTRKGGAEIVNLMKTGSAYYAPSAAVVEMVEAILKDKKKILPCAAYLEGEYGVKGLYVGVPVKLGARGVEQIIEIKLTAEERAALEKSVASVRELVTILGVA